MPAVKNISTECDQDDVTENYKTTNEACVEAEICTS